MADLPEIKPGKNNFLTFAEKAIIPDNRQDDDTYASNIRRQTGFVAGEPADNALMNTILRNNTMAMKGFTDFLAQHGVDVPTTVDPRVIQEGMLIAVENIIAQKTVEVVQPVLDKMQAQIDRYAAAYHGVPVGGILPLSISEKNLEKFLKDYPCYAVCDGNNGTIDLRDRFIISSGQFTPQGQIGGSRTFDNLSINEHVLTTEQMPRHSHEVPGSASPFKVEEWPYGAPLGSNEYIGSGASDRGYRVNSSKTGDTKGHSHNVSDKTAKGNAIPSGMLPPYYSLIFVQKILPY
ncbi:MAG: hypothetical protein K2N48_05780 [Muribaculaceae bacterium]|nr:hypothetical protein [Muribaculaceae bacterium]